VVARREQDRETTLRRGQNELAELKNFSGYRRRRIMQSPSNLSMESKLKWQKKVEGHVKGQGVYSGTDDIKFTRQPATFDPGKDISKKVDSNAAQDDGFSGKLTSGE
jgi:hypothetical protein